MGRRTAASQQSRAGHGVPVLTVVAAVVLSGCGSISQKFAETASQLPEVGLSPNAPARPAQQMAYPAVHDIPPPRTAAVLTDIEQRKLETDLVSARDQQQNAAGVPLAYRKKTLSKDQSRSKEQAKAQAKDQAAKDQTSRDQGSAPAPISASSSRSIY